MTMQATVLTGLLLLGTSLTSLAQAASAGKDVPQGGKAASSAPAVPPPSSILAPALQEVTTTLNSLNVERWHRGSIRDEASSNINSILQDINERVPPLFKSADAAPYSISVDLPLSAHVNALYEVLLRVVEASRVVAPAEQVTALQQCLEDLAKARRTFEDHMQQTATAQEKELRSLRSSLRAQAAQQPQTVAVPMVLPCGTFVVHHYVRKKRAPAPAAKPGAPGSSPASQSAKPAGSTQPQKK
jgi:hypothetical protein